MKRTIIGIALLLSATLTDIGILISASILATGLIEWHSTKLWTAITENQLLLPFILSLILFIIALTILYKEYYDKKPTKNL
jgi:predicted tellurium resistance membrane protein TerC